MDDRSPSTAETAAQVWERIAPTREDRALMRSAVRLLAGGDPVRIPDVVATARGEGKAEKSALSDAVLALALPDADAAAGRRTLRQRLAIGADIEYDAGGEIAGWGITLRPTVHGFTVGGHGLYTWCAPDTLVFPGLIGAAAAIESACPVTGTAITVHVDPESGRVEAHPATAMVAYVDPAGIVHGGVRSTCCEPQRFLADDSAARQWQATHPGMAVLPVDAAYRATVRGLDDRARVTIG